VVNNNLGSLLKEQGTSVRFETYGSEVSRSSNRVQRCREVEKSVEKPIRYSEVVKFITKST